MNNYSKFLIVLAITLTVIVFTPQKHNTKAKSVVNTEYKDLKPVPGII